MIFCFFPVDFPRFSLIARVFFHDFCLRFSIFSKVFLGFSMFVLRLSRVF